MQPMVQEELPSCLKNPFSSGDHLSQRQNGISKLYSNHVVYVVYIDEPLSQLALHPAQGFPRHRYKREEVCGSLILGRDRS